MQQFAASKSRVTAWDVKQQSLYTLCFSTLSEHIRPRVYRQARRMIVWRMSEYAERPQSTICRACNVESSVSGQQFLRFLAGYYARVWSSISSACVRVFAVFRARSPGQARSRRPTSTLGPIHCGSKKNAPTLADYNYDPVQSILIMFSKLFVNDHKSCMVVKFSTSPHICCHYTLWNTMLYFALITLLIARNAPTSDHPITSISVKEF